MSVKSPESLGVIQAKLTHLRARKAALDELILCMERYSVYKLAPRRRSTGKVRADNSTRRLAGAA
jgi:hypothetical protein